MEHQPTTPACEEKRVRPAKLVTNRESRISTISDTMAVLLLQPSKRSRAAINESCQRRATPPPNTIWQPSPCSPPAFVKCDVVLTPLVKELMISAHH